jgi:DNA repair protein RecO (recombination protein O)
MIRKTEAIVLRTQVYQESSLLATCYTREHGVMSFLVQGYRSARGKRRHSYFQPMSVIDVVYYFKENRELHRVTESNCIVFFQQLQTDPRKIALGLLVIELFQRTVREEEPNGGLFDFLRDTLIELDHRQERLIHVAIWFVLHLTAWLGFFPTDETEEESGAIWLDAANGRFIRTFQAQASDALLHRFLHSDLHGTADIHFGNTEKREMIASLFHFYRLHVEGFREPESIKVFSEVFG